MRDKSSRLERNIRGENGRHGGGGGLRRVGGGGEGGGDLELRRKERKELESEPEGGWERKRKKIGEEWEVGYVL